MLTHVHNALYHIYPIICSFLPFISTDPFVFRITSLSNSISHVFTYLFGDSIGFVITAHKIVGEALSKWAWAVTSGYTTLRKTVSWKGLKLYAHI